MECDTGMYWSLYFVKQNVRDNNNVNTSVNALEFLNETELQPIGDVH